MQQILAVLVFVVGVYFALRYWKAGDYAWTPNVVSGDAMQDGTARVIMFYVDWCPHCKKAKPIWQGLHEQFDGKTQGAYTLSIESVNCESDVPTAKLYDIEAYPTFKFVRKDKIYTYKGPLRKDTLTQFITDCIKA